MLLFFKILINIRFHFQSTYTIKINIRRRRKEKKRQEKIDTKQQLGTALYPHIKIVSNFK